MRPSLVLLALPALAVACSKPAPPAPPPPGVEVAAVLEREVKEWDEFSGRLQAVDAVEVMPRVSGYIREVAFSEGKEVRKGDVLFVIDPRPYEAAAEQARAEVVRAQTRAELAKRDADRAERLVSVQAISREEADTRAATRDEAAAAVRAAEAALATANLNLEWTRVRSPISGRVSRALVTEGNLVQAGPPTATLLTTVVSQDPIYAYFEGDEQTYLRYQQLAADGTRPSSRDVRNPVEMGLANEDGFPHKGVVDFVDNQLDPQTGTITARAVFKNTDRRLTPGLYAKIRLIGSGTYRATLIRDAAVGTDQDRKFVYVLQPDSTVAYRPVQLGRVVDGLRVVKSGLKEGELVVVNGLPRIRPGIPVSAKAVEMEPPATEQTTSSAATAP